MTRVDASEMQIDRGTWIPANPAWVLQTRSPANTDVIDYGEVAIWNRDGVSWSDAPAPEERHQHSVQSYGVVGFKQVFRCACGAIADNMRPEWVLLDKPRVKAAAERAALSVLADEDRKRRYEDAIAGAYRGGAEDDGLAAVAAMRVADAERAAILADAVTALESSADLGGCDLDIIRGWIVDIREGRNPRPWYAHLLPVDDDAAREAGL